MAEVLRAAGLEIRRNSRSLDFEVRGIGGQPAKRTRGEATQPGGWISLTDAIWAAINQVSYTIFGFRRPVTETRSPARWLQKDMKEAFLNLCPEPVDPFIEWLETLPAWDGEPRMRRLWIDTLGMPDDELSKEGARRFLIGAIRRAYEPGAVHDWMLVLVGPQGLGKSSVLRELVSPSPFWHTDGVTLDGTKRELFESLGSTVLAEFSEMGGLERHNQSQFKAWLTRNYDRVRPAYARIPENIQRRFVPVGTANPSHRGVIPHDPTGARRYLVLESTFTGEPNELKAYAAKARAWVQERLCQLWAEALHDYIATVDRGEQDMNLIPAYLATSQQHRADGYTQEDESMANLAEDLKDYGREYEEQKKYGPELTELMRQGKLAKDKTEALRLSREQRKLGDALVAAGWKKKKKRYEGKVQTRWFAPPLDYPADQDDPPPMTHS